MPSEAYDLADRLLQLAPWEWMPEIYLIALDDPDSGQRHHISLMGMNGIHRTLALYLGPEARFRFNRIQESRNDMPRDDLVALILDTPQHQCSFAEREDLFPSELAAIKAAGRKYRDEDYPTFRAFQPGRCPAPADEVQTRLLLTAIEQVLEVTPSIRLGDDTLRLGNDRPEILTRRFIEGGWRTEWTEDDIQLFEFPSPRPAEILVETVRRHRRATALEVAFLLIPNPIGESRETSVYPYILLVVESSTRLIIGVELLTVESLPHKALIASVPDHFLRLCNKSGIRPSSLSVVSPATAALLTPTAEALGIRLQRKKRLPSLDAALGSLLGALG